MIWHRQRRFHIQLVNGLSQFPKRQSGHDLLEIVERNDEMIFEKEPLFLASRKDAHVAGFSSDWTVSAGKNIFHSSLWVSGGKGTRWENVPMSEQRR